MDSLPITKLELHQPDEHELCSVLEKGLKNSFEEASVIIVDCPNLEKEPYNLAAKGICGQPTLLDVGGVKNLVPVAKKNKIYSLHGLAKLMEFPDAFLIGAGAGPFHKVGVNCEFMANIRTSFSEQNEKNLSYIARLDPKSEHKLLQMPENNECGLMLNALASEGKEGRVIQVKAKKRTRDTNFITVMRETLKIAYGEKPIGIGGVFLIQTGKAKLHIMPDFPTTPFIDNAEVDSWLKYFEMDAPLVCLSTFVSHDPGLDLRNEHTHCFSAHGQGGHYHYDTTPEDVEYLGYFVPAEVLYRIDKP